MNLSSPFASKHFPGIASTSNSRNGTKGEVDLSRLAGKGVFQVWNDYHFFENVSIGDHREIKWDSEIELCGDSLYLELTHKSPEDLFPQLQREQPHA